MGARSGAAAALLVAGFALAGGSGRLSAQEYHVDWTASRSALFESSTRIDTFQGRTEAVDGYVLLDGGGLRPAEGSPGEFYFEVDLASLTTGIGLRDRHMRENYLEVASHPYAVFRGGIDWIRPAPDGGYRVRATGSFGVHGVDRSRTLDCAATPEAGAIRVSCSFPVMLADHDIEVPQLMFLRLAEEVRVEVEFRLRPIDAGPIQPPDAEAHA